MGPPHDFDEFNPNNPYTQLALLAKRVDDLGQQKEELERREEAAENRITKLEFLLSKERVDKMDAATTFMSNAEFMGKWTWRAVYGFIILSGGFFAAFKFWKGTP